MPSDVVRVTMTSAAWFGPQRPSSPRPRMPVLPLGFLKRWGDRVEVTREQDGAALHCRIVADTFANLHLVVDVELVRPHWLLSLVKYALPNQCLLYAVLHLQVLGGLHVHVAF